MTTRSLGERSRRSPRSTSLANITNASAAEPLLRGVRRFDDDVDPDPPAGADVDADADAKPDAVIAVDKGLAHRNQA